jgi:integrase
VAVLIAWAIEMQSHGSLEDSHIFEREGITIIDDITISATMKAIAQSVGLGSNLISTHSLRYGGATLLAAAGIPAYAITYFGGWSDNSPMLRTYAQLGGQMANDVSRVMSEAFDRSLVEARIRDNTLSGR